MDCVDCRRINVVTERGWVQFLQTISYFFLFSELEEVFESSPFLILFIYRQLLLLARRLVVHLYVMLLLLLLRVLAVVRLSGICQALIGSRTSIGYGTKRVLSHHVIEIALAPVTTIRHIMSEG